MLPIFGRRHQVPIGMFPGSWGIHQSDIDLDGDTVVAFYDKNTPITFNVPRGTTIEIVQRSGDQVVHLQRTTVDMPFATYPMFQTDQSGYELEPTGYSQAQAQLQFLEIPFIVREQEYYTGKPDFFLDITIEFGGKKYQRSYRQIFKRDPFSSGKPNDYINRLVEMGQPFVAEHAGWEGFLPLTGDFQYASGTETNPYYARYDGIFTTCFWNDGEAQLTFPAFQQLSSSMLSIGTSGLEAVLEMLNAGLGNSYRTLPDVFQKATMTNSAGTVTPFLLLPTKRGTYVIQENMYASVYFVERKLTPSEFSSLTSGGRLYPEMLALHQFDTDPLCHHRALVNNVSFWKVLNMVHPAPASGGNPNKEMPLEFVVGVIRFVIDKPLWYMRFGGFASLP